MRVISRIYGVILAAGESKRMGSPKALLTLDDGKTLLARQVEFLAQGGCAETACVVGAEAELIMGFDEEIEAQWLLNEDWKDGQFTSIQTGLAWMLDQGGGGALVLPVDCVLDSTSTVGAIVETAALNPHVDAIVPEFEGKGGHPVYISRQSAKKLISIDHARKDARLDLQLGTMEKILRLPVADAGIVRNANTPDEWETIKESLTT